MSFSGHDRLRILLAVRDDDVEELTVHASSVVLTYAGVRVVVTRRDWTVVHPPELAEVLTDEGVPERARRAVENREGVWVKTPGPEYQLAAEAFRRELHSS